MEKVTETIKVEELRKIASSLGIKNVKKFKKDELIQKTNEIVEQINQEELRKEQEVKAKEELQSQEKKRNEKIKVSNAVVSRLRSEYNIPEHCVMPQGEASVDIYEEILKHKNYKKWRMYRLKKKGYSYTNIRRVWKLYIEPYLEELGFEERYKDLKQRW